MKHNPEEAYDRIKRLTDRTINSVHRVELPPEIIVESRKRFTDRISSEIKESLTKVKTTNELSNRLLAPSRESLKGERHGGTLFADFQAAQRAAHQDRALPNKGRHIASRANIEDLVIGTAGYSVFTPPWDIHDVFPNDSTQFVQGFTDTVSASTILCLGSNDAVTGFAWAGFAVYLSSPVNRAVSIRPFMRGDYTHSGRSYLFNANTRGGFGTLVYDGNAGIVPGTDLKPVIWDQTTSGAQDVVGVTGEVYIQQSLTNGEISFTMNAGENYQLWLYTWGHGDQSGEELGTFGDPWGSWVSFELDAVLPLIVVLS
jgi:hypothetical protein